MTNIQELVERSLFERLRLVCVQYGYTPDITTFPQTQQGQRDYEQALKDIQENPQFGFSIEIFNSQNFQGRGVLKIPRITIDPQPFMEGALGGDLLPRYSKNPDGTYKSTILPPQTAEYYCHIILTCQNAKQIRVLNSILSLAIPQRGYIPWYDQDDLQGNFFVKRTAEYKGNTTEHGITEYTYRYMVPDLFQIESPVINPNVNPVIEVDVDMEIKKPDGTITDSDNTVYT